MDDSNLKYACDVLLSEPVDVIVKNLKNAFLMQDPYLLINSILIPPESMV